LQACTDYGKRREVHVLLIFSSQEHKTGAGKMHALKLLYILLEYSFFSFKLGEVSHTEEYKSANFGTFGLITRDILR